MKTKILILGLIFLFFFAYCKSPASPDIEKILEPQNSTQVEFHLILKATGQNVMLVPPNHLWHATIEFYVNNQYIGESAEVKFTSGWADTGKLFIPSLNYQRKQEYIIKFKFKNTDVPSKWQENIGFRIYLEVRTIDKDFTIEGEYLGWYKIDTGYFNGWKVGEWKESPIYSFRVL